MTETFYTNTPKPVETEDEHNNLVAFLSAVDVGNVHVSLGEIHVEGEDEYDYQISEKNPDSNNFFAKNVDALYLNIRVRVECYDNAAADLIKPFVVANINGVAAERKQKLQTELAQKIAESEALQKEIENLNQQIS